MHIRSRLNSAAWFASPPAAAMAILIALGGCATSPVDRSAASLHTLPRIRTGRGAPWTILCLELRGQRRDQLIKDLAETLQRTPGVRAREVFVLSGSDEVSRLYHGVYYRPADAKTGKRAIPKRLARDLQWVKELGEPPNRHYFLHAMMVSMPTPDVGRPEWALQRVDAVYSLQVAVFQPTDHLWDHKRAAADYCQALRDRGFEAYYHHAAASSVVTVGRFGADAVIDRIRGLPSYSPVVTALRQSDALLRYNHLNGRVYKARDSAGAMVPVDSRLVRIPHSGETQR